MKILKQFPVYLRCEKYVFSSFSFITFILTHYFVPMFLFLVVPGPGDNRVCLVVFFVFLRTPGAGENIRSVLLFLLKDLFPVLLLWMVNELEKIPSLEFPAGMSDQSGHLFLLFCILNFPLIKFYLLFIVFIFRLN